MTIQVQEQSRPIVLVTLDHREALLPWALETAETIAAHSPTAVRAVRQQTSTTLAEQALAREALDQALGDRVRASPHFMEDVTALRQKRVPK